MFTDRWMDKVIMAHIYNGILPIKRNKTGSFVETWMDLESEIWREVRKRKPNVMY